MEEILDLTPRQREEVYFHPRDEKGVIRPPVSAAEHDPKARILQLIGLIQGGLIKTTPDKLAELQRRLCQIQSQEQ
jgi:hypothetical protein